MTEMDAQRNEPKQEVAEIPEPVFEIDHSRQNVLDLLPSDLAADIQLAVDRYPELFRMDEKSLLKTLRSRQQTPNQIDNALRMRFWAEYQRASMAGTKMSIVKIYTGVCGGEFFKSVYAKNKTRMAWMMCIPASYEMRMEESLVYAIDEMRTILELPLIDEKSGKINFSLAALKFRIAEKLHTIVKGAVVTKNVNVNIGENAATDKKIQEAILSNNMVEIQKRLKELEHRDRMIDIIEIEGEPEPKPKVIEPYATKEFALDLTDSE